MRGRSIRTICRSGAISCRATFRIVTNRLLLSSEIVTNRHFVTKC